MFLAGVLVFCVGALLLVYGSTFYPLRHEFEREEDFTRVRRRVRSYQYLGGVLVLLALAAAFFS